MKKHILGILAAMCLTLVLMPTARASDIVSYAVTGGSIQFDKDTGEVTGCSMYVTAANIPETIEGVSVTSIGDRAFGDCSSLTSVTIPNSVTSIGDFAFNGCRNLTSVTISNSVTSMGYSAFAFCGRLTNVIIPNGVTSIGSCAFQSCSGLTTVNIPDTVTSIGSFAFVDCSGLASVTIPSSVTSIEDGAFGGCDGIRELTLASGNTHYSVIDGVLFSSDETILHTYPAGKNGVYSIPSSVTSIGGGAFYGCSGLTDVTIPNSVTSIGSQAFEECSGLTSVTIPNNVASIGAWAFYGCWNLTSVTIPNSVTTIDHDAFGICSSLTSVTIPNSVISINVYAFYDCNSLTDVYYDGTQEEYKTKLLPKVDSSNSSFLNATFHFKENTSPNPNPGSTLPNTAASDNTTFHGTIFLLLAALTLTVLVLGQRKKDNQPKK